MAQQTAKEKAQELVFKYIEFTDNPISLYNAKHCALITIDEILNNNCGSYTDESNATNNEIYCDEYYWQEVKTEIEKL
jgi:hypothetical protein